MTDQPRAMTDTFSGEDPRIVRARQEVHWALTIDEHKALICDLLTVVTELQAERDRTLDTLDAIAPYPRISGRRSRHDSN